MARGRPGQSILPHPQPGNMPLFALDILLEGFTLCLDEPSPVIPPSVPLQGVLSLFQMPSPTWPPRKSLLIP